MFKIINEKMLLLKDSQDSVWIVNSISFDSELFKLDVMECLPNGSGQRSYIVYPGHIKF